MNNRNEPIRWGTVRVIPVSEIPSRASSKYLGLYQDINLRLEQTSPTEALVYPFDDQKALKGAYTAMKKMFKNRGVVVLIGPEELCVYKAAGTNGRGRRRGVASVADDAGYEEIAAR